MHTNKILYSAFLFLVMITISLIVIAIHIQKASVEFQSLSKMWGTRSDSIDLHYSFHYFTENKTMEYFEKYLHYNTRNSLYPFYLFRVIQQYNPDILYFKNLFSVAEKSFLIDNTHIFNCENSVNFDYVYTPAIVGGFYLFKDNELIGFSLKLKQSNNSILEEQLKDFIYPFSFNFTITE